MLTWSLFIGQFVHPLGGEDGVKRLNGGIIISASYKFQFNRVHDNLV